MDTLPTAISQVLATFHDEMIVAYLFGSYARGTARRSSDVDLGILFASPPPRTICGRRQDVADAIEREIHRTVDLVVLNHAPVDLVHRILRDGTLLYERDREKRITFEVDARNRYFDLQPILRRYREAA